MYVKLLEWWDRKFAGIERGMFIDYQSEKVWSLLSKYSLFVCKIASISITKSDCYEVNQPLEW